MGKMADLLYELQEYERIEEQLEAMKKKEEEYKEEIKRLEEENKKVKELFLELFRSKSDA
jgi:cell shape-determining protein MreC